MTYWEHDGSQCIAFTNSSMTSFVRLLMNPHVMLGSPLSVGDAWATYLDLRQRQGVIHQAETDGCVPVLHRWIEASLVTQRVFADAHLAAVAVATNARVVTFDDDFKRFPGLDLLLLKV